VADSLYLFYDYSTSAFFFFVVVVVFVVIAANVTVTAMLVDIFGVNVTSFAAAASVNHPRTTLFNSVFFILLLFSASLFLSLA